ncbi:MAG TPA: branched-chain amino acid ABC transporter permease [Steroidobacteraceae bacterium]|jgi:branched-chain amino acid transport system permease protein
MTTFLGVLFDGVAYGSLLFLLSLGMSVTLGLMKFANLAHGVFGMLGGYVVVVATGQWGWPFLAALPLAFVVGALLGALLERLLFRRLYGAGPLDQVLFTIGVTYVGVASATWYWGPSQQPIQLPAFLSGQTQPAGIGLGSYRLFLVAAVVVIGTALVIALTRTNFGARVRASVDNTRAAAGIGINVNRIFCTTFAIGSGLGALGGALAVDIVGLDPNFPIRFLVYFLLVVVVGGTGNFAGPLIAAMVVGIADVTGRYYLPEVGAFLVYALMIAMLLLFPQGLYGRRA